MFFSMDDLKCYIIFLENAQGTEQIGKIINYLILIFNSERFKFGKTKIFNLISIYNNWKLSSDLYIINSCSTKL